MRAVRSTQGGPNGASQPALAGATGDGGSFQGEQPIATPYPRDDGSTTMQKPNSYHTQFPDPDWHQIAERAADEKDPKKLAFLIKALCDRLEELRQSKFPEKKT
jgi:hypothetical protein